MEIIYGTPQVQNENRLPQFVTKQPIMDVIYFNWKFVEQMNLVTTSVNMIDYFATILVSHASQHGLLINN